jgi:hypothetical protein
VRLKAKPWVPQGKSAADAITIRQTREDASSEKGVPMDKVRNVAAPVLRVQGRDVQFMIG